MSTTLTLKESKYIPATELDNLEAYIGRTFLVERNGVSTAHKLIKLSRRDVYLGYPDGREDSFTLSINKFRKFYKLAPSSRDKK
ncbi:hypothetical protein KEN51_CDS0197 [Pseudomonas phage vB_Pae10145-KEN51]|uniref:hypothetical protein n=1 Tax=Pseudomonas aeruginosa TaxID=287 RepID=UPI0010249339|nr:hypothetical protein [Pseudomonas aeruginosa]QGK89860.1 hypothetical protein [Pseudomonas phage vB_PA32_GUMS]QOV08078.1 hypothetical protein [Pseudomonas phage vB_PaeM_kmuB]QYV99093.1 hypothetical protein [Pseudomonas phage T2P]QYV99387.1 hypothetical protein [Pseudomonas phage U1B]QYV99843.1 hypothetical protein [Pseudomonas phage U5]UNI71710.1 hypothetical protein Churi01_gp128 [Pseudomonas phage Churi01]UXD83206.1 hypothetical protein NP274_00154 [Pseudomonas phage Koomba boorn-mokiny 